MSLIKKADVKDYLANKARAKVYPFGLRPSAPAAAPKGKAPGAKEVTDISSSPSHPLAQEGVANAQVGGAVGVPAGGEKSGKRSW